MRGISNDACVYVHLYRDEAPQQNDSVLVGLPVLIKISL